MASNRHSRAGGNPVSALITDNIDVWTSAIKKRNATGRGSSKKIELTGIKKLRELILELAVRGKLVPQDGNDEPASVLLEKIASKKAQLIADKKIKKQKALPAITDEEKPFDLPKTWSFNRLIHLSILENGDRSKNYPNKSLLVDNGIPFVNAGHLQGGLIDQQEMTYITQERFDLLRAGKFKLGDILYCLRGSLGKSALVDELTTGAIASSLVIIRTHSELAHRYLMYYFDSPFAYKLIKKYDNGTAQPNLSATDLAKFIVPIPPLAEQHRIVAKVDELMALCDQLEQQTEQSLSAHQTLVEVLLGSLLSSTSKSAEGSATESKDVNDFQSSWQRIVEHFDLLFTTEHSIEQLKQTILQLAVMGKLVPQNPNDEPASVLLEKIVAKKAQLITDKKIKKPKALPAITDEDKPFELPSGWKFERLENMTSLITKGSSPKWQGVSYTEDPTDVLFVTSENVGAFELRLDKKKFVEKKFNDVEPRSILQKNDFLMNIVGASIGRTATYNIDTLANINQAVCLIRSFPSLSCNKYFLTFFNSNICISYMYDKQVDNARPNLSMANISKFVIPVPPLAEQRRIVAKVDELMALCEQLKARLSDAQTTQLHLADAVVENALVN